MKLNITDAGMVNNGLVSYRNVPVDNITAVSLPIISDQVNQGIEKNLST